MNTYPFTLDIRCQETGVILFPNFECDISISAMVVDGQLVTNCRDVLIEGVSLKHKSELSQMIRNVVMEAADEDLDNAGRLWDAVAKAEGIFVGGAGGPDAHFYQVA